MSHPQLLTWDIYEIQSDAPIHGVMLRGRLRKLALDRHTSFLCENASDADNTVRFAVLRSQDVTFVLEYLHSILSATVTLMQEDVPNPVLSKLKVNIASRYEL